MTHATALAPRTPGSSGYRKHTDAMPDDSADGASGVQRKLTAVCYCNTNWLPGDGGALRITLQDHQAYIIYILMFVCWCVYVSGVFLISVWRVSYKHIHIICTHIILYNTCTHMYYPGRWHR
jgi:hypothetical protein